MERSIKFRGKYAKSHEWIYGHYYNNCDIGLNQDIIINHNEDTGSGREHLISQQYLGEFTGLSDKNGKEIYEGDIVKCGYGTGEVIYNAGCFMVCWLDDVEAYMEFLFSRKGMYRRKDDEEFEVIGNIHDNPEIIKSLKGEEEKI